MMDNWLVLVESNTTGTGRLFCARARQMGLRPALFARDPGRYPYLVTDAIDHWWVDTADAVAVRAACAELDGLVAGVTSSSEYFIAIASEIARSLGLPHPDPDAVRACRDKSVQRARLRDAGLAPGRFAAATTVDAAVAVAQRIDLPVVVKPVAGSGSIGVRLCATRDEVRAAAAAVLEVDPTELALPAQGAVVVEEYVSGPEFSVETFDDNVIGITRKHLGAEPYFVEIGHDFPASLSPGDQAALGEAALAALRALGLGWGPAHVELRLTPAGPRVIEVNPRLAGGMIPRMVEEATGVDLIALTVARAAGGDVAPRPTRALAASIRFLVAEAGGHLVEVTGTEEASRIPGVVEVRLTREAGQDVVLRHSFQDRLGYVIAADRNGAVARRSADAGARSLKASITPAALTPEGRSRA